MVSCLELREYEWGLGHIILLILQLKRLNFASNMAVERYFCHANWAFKKGAAKLANLKQPYSIGKVSVTDPLSYFNASFFKFAV